jgi:hypothetical protein
MKYLLVIADTNDADYIQTFKEVTDEDLEVMKPLFEAIKNFKPYTTRKDAYGYAASMTHRHNFPTNDCCRKDLGEKTIEQIYKDIDEDSLLCFTDEYCPHAEHGIHTIESIEIVEVTNRVKLV